MESLDLGRNEDFINSIWDLGFEIWDVGEKQLDGGWLDDLTNPSPTKIFHQKLTPLTPYR